MSAKEFLKKIITIDLVIDSKIEQVERLRDRLTNVTASTQGERVQTSKQGDSMSDTIAKIVDLESKINKDIDTLVEYKEQAREMIETLDNDVEKVILYEKYFEHNTFEQIAVRCNLSWRWVHKLHGDALQKLNKLMA